jgi:hypothetical protein
MLYAAAFPRLYLSDNWPCGIEPVVVTIGPALSPSSFRKRGSELEVPAAFIAGNGMRLTRG